MDWDGVGTFALFLSSGAVGLGIIALRAYKAKLASKLEWARLERASDAAEDAQEQIREIENEVRQLRDRVEFTERLISGGTTAAPRKSDSPDEAE